MTNAPVTEVDGAASAYPGAMVTQNVRLVRELGAGGMGRVWLAEHLALRAPVVVKFMSGALASNADYVARFSREAAAASQVRSPHVVQMLDHGVTPDGIPYIVMEFLEGRDLGVHIAERGCLALQEITPIVIQVCKALTQAHKRNIVHRDIKPENIFLCDQGDDLFVKLLDFGIARNTEVASTATATGTVMGSPPYMSPEQLIGSKNVDHRTDLWAIGVVVYEALTGRRPFDADTVGALAVQLHTSELPVPSHLVATLPPGVDQWFARACARNPDDRFSSAKEMADALLSIEGAAGPRTMRLMLPEGGPPRPFAFFTPSMLRAGEQTADVATPSLHTAQVSTPESSATPEPSRDSIALTIPRAANASGSAFAVTAIRAPSDSVPPPPRSKTPIFVVLALLVFAGGGWFAWTRLDGNKSERPTQSSAASSSQASVTDHESKPSQSETPPAPKLKSARVRVVLPPGAILKIGPNEATSKIAKDGTIELSGPENAAFRLAIYKGKTQLVSQTHVLYDDDVVDPKEIDPDKGEQLTAKPPPTAIKSGATTASSAKPTSEGTPPTQVNVTSKKLLKVDETAE